jgi:ribosomal protein S18 acetylase RimI-like enzyme
MLIRPATTNDHDAISTIATQIAAEGTTYFFDDTTDIAAFWFGPGRELFVAEDGGIVGFYLIEPNIPGRGSHVAHAAYMVAPSAQGRGIGKMLAEHSLETARARGYLAMQFNLVVSTNERAVRAWRSAGFSIVGTIPRAFRHQTLGLVDAFVMHRFL